MSDPKPATDDELRRHPLPVDVQIGNAIFREGTPLLTIIATARYWLARAEGKEPPIA